MVNDEVSRAGYEGKEDFLVDVLVKFLISIKTPLNFINDSRFRALLQTVAQHGEPFCAILESPSILQWRFEHVIKQHMQMVMESWKSTGCTLMLYHLRQQDKQLLLGLYSPKGFIFTLGNALNDLVPDSLLSHVIQVVRHDPCQFFECQFRARDPNDCSVDSFLTKNTRTREINCTQQQLQVFWSSVYETSQMVRTVTGSSDLLYEYMVTSPDLYARFHRTLKRREVEEAAYGTAASSIARLGVVMELQFELKQWLSDCGYRINTEIRQTIHDTLFWGYGSEIAQALTPLFELTRVVGTLVPSSGYLEAAIDEAAGVLKTYSESKPWTFKKIWDCFERLIFNGNDTLREATRYLSPAYILRHKLLQVELCAWCLYDLAEAYEEEEEEEALDAEIKAYCITSSNPFANISMSECQANHPVTLWSKYGSEFPLLQKCAYKLLSQPVCCLCNQVEKRLSTLQGEDNYIMRLNALMMEDFTKMGDQIYQPIHF